MHAHHLSWWRILTAAIVQKEHQGIDDPDQAWILGELIRYLEDDRSGASGFEDMGDKWTNVRDSARSMTLRQGDPSVHEIADRWEQFIEFVALDLRQTLGRPIAPAWPRRSTRESRVAEASRSLAQEGVLAASIKVPDAAAPLDLVVNLRTRQLTTSATVNAPKEGRPQTRINWFLRQAREMPADLRVDHLAPLVARTGVRIGDVATLAPGRVVRHGLRPYHRHRPGVGEDAVLTQSLQLSWPAK